MSWRLNNGKNELEELVAQLLKGVDDQGVQLPGLMMDNSFRVTMDPDAVKGAEPKYAQAAQEARNEQYKGSLFRYCPVRCKMNVCPADGASLVQENLAVKNKDGKDKKLSMLHCRKCGRKFINVAALSVSIHLEDYYLEAVASENW